MWEWTRVLIDRFCVEEAARDCLEGETRYDFERNVLSARISFKVEHSAHSMFRHSLVVQII